MSRQHVSVLLATSLGLASLAAAMGIGRFAFTPIFPLMQKALGVTLNHGAWLATANYVGYFLGALGSYALTPKVGSTARWGLLAVALSTFGMALTNSFAAWLLLRLIAGVASAFVLVGASAWALAHLADHRRSDLAGWVFAGVGIGILLAGCVALTAGRLGVAPAQAWGALGAATLVVAGISWNRWSDTTPPVPAQACEGAAALDRSAWLLVACYGSFGFGYIIPATFIPAAGRTLVDDPSVFGWAWPLFGLAAAVSTILATTLFRSCAPRKTAAMSLLVMAGGVAASAVHASITTLTISAICVGGTFMVMTMAGVQEARRIAKGTPTKLISALTAAFAVGQLAGPLMVILRLSASDAFTLPSAVAAVVLMLSALALMLSRGGEMQARTARFQKVNR